MECVGSGVPLEGEPVPRGRDRARPMTEHTTTVQVHWGDVDPAGIAFYPRFFEWYDLGCEALFAALGLAWPEAFPRYGIVSVPIVESGSKFASPVRYGDVLTIRSRGAWVREKTFRLEHEISARGTPCASGFDVRACPIPEDVAQRLRGV